MGHDHSSPRSKVKVRVTVRFRVGISKDGNAVGLTSILDQRQLFS